MGACSLAYHHTVGPTKEKNRSPQLNAVGGRPLVDGACKSAAYLAALAVAVEEILAVPITAACCACGARRFTAVPVVQEKVAWFVYTVQISAMENSVHEILKRLERANNMNGSAVLPHLPIPHVVSLFSSCMLLSGVVDDPTS